MWKLIIALVLIIYLVNKLAAVFFRMGRHQAPPFQRRPDGKVNVDNTGKPNKGRGGIKGGEYVDYEEVK